MKFLNIDEEYKKIQQGYDEYKVLEARRLEMILAGRREK